jgi:transcriptional regulator with XRE-family HTH domain
MALGQAIRDLRQKRGITQEELASVVEVHPTYISMIEAGRRNVAWSTRAQDQPWARGAAN